MYPFRIEVDPLLVKPGHGDGQEIQLQIAISWRQRADAVEGDDDGLRILEFKEDVLVEQRLLVFLVLLGRRDGTLLDEVRPLSHPTLALLLDSETV